jgi:predicted N-formylglutamate amidohydrolase
LLIDLNRSPDNPKLIPRESFGRRIPGNAGLTAFERRERMRRYYEPYREAVLSDIRAGQARGEVSMHFSLHSFTDRIRQRDSRVDVGVLYDPARALERALALCLVDALKASGFHVRRNYPYRGTSDGLTTHCRRIFPPDAYLGIEFEINQRIIGRRDRIRSLSTALGAVIEAALQGISAHQPT